MKEYNANEDFSLGFGIHAGWSFEGTLGSTFKINATYLSPHVSLAAKIQKLSSIYGV